MKKKIKELTDEEAYAIENGDLITDGTNPPSSDPEDLQLLLFGSLEEIRFLKDLTDRYEKAESNLRTIETLIIESIGKEPYLDIMDLIYVQQLRLEQNIKEEWKSYHSIISN